ncbi:MAG: GyrI-like domain-containing protein [Propionibacteriaceae bacterium]|nr:GyrI-like domain-containing protein [Propionibacteriaceae bacterium]
MIDLKKDLKHLYQPGPKDFVEVDVPPMTYLAVDGEGDPNTSPEYATAVELLFTTGYSIRAAFKQRTGDAFTVGPLEGLWSSPDPTVFTARTKDAWHWTMLIPLPVEVTPEDIEQGRQEAAAKKKDLPHHLLEVREIHEGRSLQIMHIGSYDDEGPTLARLHHELMPALGVTFNGPHHEIYLSDPRKVAPEKLRTVLRQPID